MQSAKELEAKLKAAERRLEALTEQVRRIDAQVRASDVAARFGGEEFVILLPDTTSAEGQYLAERIRAAVAAAPFELPEGGDVDVTVSIGIAEFTPGDGDTDLKLLCDALILKADVALYGAKGAGRDRVVVEAA